MCCVIFSTFCGRDAEKVCWKTTASWCWTISYQKAIWHHIGIMQVQASSALVAGKGWETKWWKRCKHGTCPACAARHVLPGMYCPGCAARHVLPFYINRTAFEPRHGKAIGRDCSNCPRANVLWCAEHGSTLEAMCKRTRCGEQPHTARAVPCCAFSCSYLANLCFLFSRRRCIKDRQPPWSGCFGSMWHRGQLGSRRLSPVGKHSWSCRQRFWKYGAAGHLRSFWLLYPVVALFRQRLVRSKSTVHFSIFSNLKSSHVPDFQETHQVNYIRETGV